MASDAPPTRPPGKRAAPLKDDRKRASSATSLLPFRTHPSPLLLVDAESTRILDANDAAARFYGRDLADLRRLDLEELRERSPARGRSPSARSLTARSLERHVLGDGQIRDVELEVGAIEIDDEKQDVLLVVVRDVGQMRAAERATAGERERVAVTLSSIADGVATTDLRGRVLMLNPAAEAITGWAGHEATGQPLATVLRLSGEEALRLSDPVSLLCPPSPPRYSAVVTMRLDAGGERLLELDAAPLREDDGEFAGLVLVFRDVTDRQRREDERARAEKLDALAILAGGIAHDFNNLLTVILGNLAMVDVSEGADSVLEPLKHAEKAVIKARGLTQQLLTFSRGGAPVREHASLAAIIRDSVSLALRGSPVTSQIDLAPDLDLVEVDKSQIHQVLDNLLINAVQAMPRGGHVHVTACNTERAPKPLHEGRWVKVTVSDNGIGIPSENLGRLFDPYFSTKSRGSGLGLATAFSIVKRHEGWITVESKLGRGTAFVIFLPAAAAAAPPAKAATKREKGGSGRILVMDDEPEIRRVAAHLLGKLGYSVSLAADGAEAIERYEEARYANAPFDLVILDLTVAGAMGGQEAMERLLALDPGVCAIISSGYVNGPVLQNFQDYGFAGVLEKPFEKDELARAVARALRRAATAASHV